MPQSGKNKRIKGIQGGFGGIILYGQGLDIRQGLKFGCFEELKYPTIPQTPSRDAWRGCWRHSGLRGCNWIQARVSALPQG